MNEAEQMTSRHHWAEDQTLPMGCPGHIYDFTALGYSIHENARPEESELLPPRYLYSIPVGKERFAQGLPKEDLWKQSWWQPVWDFLWLEHFIEIGSKLRHLWSHFCFVIWWLQNNIKACLKCWWRSLCWGTPASVNGIVPNIVSRGF